MAAPDPELERLLKAERFALSVTTGSEASGERSGGGISLMDGSNYSSPRLSCKTSVGRFSPRLTAPARPELRTICLTEAGRVLS